MDFFIPPPTSDMVVDDGNTKSTVFEQKSNSSSKWPSNKQHNYSKPYWKPYQKNNNNNNNTQWKSKFKGKSFKRTTIEDDIVTLISKLKTFKLKNKLKDTQVTLIIDSREHCNDIRGIVEQYNQFDASNSGTVDNGSYFSIKYQELSEGDFVILLNGKLVKIYERKRLDDFVASIRDGRLRKQTANMSLLPEFRQDWAQQTRVVWIVEKMKSDDAGDIVSGDLDWLVESSETLFNEVYMERLTIQSAMLNREFRDNMHWHVTEGCRHTVMYILHCCLKTLEFTDIWIPRMSTQLRYKEFRTTSVSNNENDKSTNEEETMLTNGDIYDHLETAEQQIKFLETRPLPKKSSYKELDGIDKQKASYIMQLMTIDKMSIGKAMCIVDVYPTPKSLSDLMNQHQHEPEKVVKTLMKLTHPMINNKLGPQMAIQLFNIHHATNYKVKSSGKLVKEEEEEQHSETASESSE